MMARINFADELSTAERGLLSEGQLVRGQLSKVMDALERRDPELAQKVIMDDDLIDDVYLATDARILNLIALQAPVASDLRLVSALLHSNVHLERIGDLCVNVAKFVLHDHAHPPDAPLLATLLEMGVRAGEMIEVALKALADRDVDLAETLPDRDDSIDQLNRQMLEQLASVAGQPDRLEWAMKLLLVGRYLERIGDHAVDIGEQTSFLVTGVFREFTDASHD